jgi:EamA domain-containing membrane protein RarD
MTIEQVVRMTAGTLVLTSLTLGYFFNPLWHLVIVFVGANLLQSAFTRWCLLEDILSKLGVARACDLIASRRNARALVQP